MRKFFLTGAIFLGAAICAGVVLAVSKEDIVFPVAELGNCQTEETCRAYCDQPANMNVCLDFAQAHNLISEEELTRGREFAEVLAAGGGPAGCQTPDQCESYCEDVTHIEECLAFAEEHGFDVPEAQEARKIRDYLAAGGKMPGGCTTKDQCQTYCSDFNNFEICFAFAEAAGLEIGDGDKEFTRDQMRRMLELMRQGRTPGGCLSENECEAYCSNEANIEECMNFGIEVGFISNEEAEIFRKTGGKGPAGCSGREECETFCNNPANQEACFAFAREHGLLSEDDLERAREGMSRLREAFEQAPPEVAECLKASVGQNIIDEIRAGTLTPGPEIGDRVRTCFEQFGGGPGSEFHGEGEFERSGGFGESGDRSGPAVDVSDLPVGLQDIEGIESILRQVPAELRSCVAERLNQRGVSPDVVYVGIEECSRQLQSQLAPPSEPSGDSSQGTEPEQYQQEFERQYQEQLEQQSRGPSLGEFLVAGLGLLFGFSQ